MKDGGIEYAQLYGAGSAGDAMYERNVLGSILMSQYFIVEQLRPKWINCRRTFF